MENCEIYFSGVTYKGESWLDNPDYLMQQIYNNLNEIKTFDFASVSLNMAQVFNVSLKTNNYDSMVLFLKKVRFKYKEFLSMEDIKELTEKIKKTLTYIDNFNFIDMDIRTSVTYTDKELGIVQPRRKSL